MGVCRAYLLDLIFLRHEVWLVLEDASQAAIIPLEIGFASEPSGPLLCALNTRPAQALDVNASFLR